MLHSIDSHLTGMSHFSNNLAGMLHFTKTFITFILLACCTSIDSNLACPTLAIILLALSNNLAGMLHLAIILLACCTSFHCTCAVMLHAFHQIFLAFIMGNVWANIIYLGDFNILMGPIKVLCSSIYIYSYNYIYGLLSL